MKFEIIKQLEKEIEEKLNSLIFNLKTYIPKEDYFLFKGRIGEIMDLVNEFAKRTLEKTLKTRKIQGDKNENNKTIRKRN